MKLKEILSTIISKDLQTESKSYSFKVRKISKEYSGFKYTEYLYSFSIDDINYECYITPNLWRKHYYDVAFAVKGGSTKDRVKKDIDFMNSVLKTVADCMIDFINDMDKLNILAFEGDRLREKVYVRFFRNHPYFSKFEIDDTHTKSGFVEIHIEKGLD